MMVYHASLHGYSGGLVERIVNHWATKLLHIRLYSPNYTTFQLKVYACLRDGSAVKFDDLTMYRPMIQDLLDKAGAAGGGGDNKGKANRETTCSHCKSHKAHELLGIAHSFGSCPFKPPNCDRKQARAAGNTLLRLWQPTHRLIKPRPLSLLLPMANPLTKLGSAD
jgi:hypothetical protein